MTKYTKYTEVKLTRERTAKLYRKADKLNKQFKALPMEERHTPKGLTLRDKRDTAYQLADDNKSGKTLTEAVKAHESKSHLD